MRVKKPRIMALYVSACKECAAAGVDMSPEDYAWLYDAACRAVDCGRESTFLLDPPVKVGNVTLYPQTLGAMLWWKQYGEKWFCSACDEDQVVAIAWMLSHARDKNKILAMTSRRRFIRELVKWQLGVSFRTTISELSWGIISVFGGRESISVGDKNKENCPTQASSIDWGGAVARLCFYYGGNPEHYLWEIGEDAARELLEKAPRQDGTQREEEESERREYIEFLEIVRHMKSRRGKAE